jgi:carbon monoxide dehydrogenase subunit G
MAMTMNGEYELPVPPQTVWEKLNDPPTLKACIPGCEQLDKTSDTEFQAVATVKIECGRGGVEEPLAVRIRSSTEWLGNSMNGRARLWASKPEPNEI